MGDSFKELEDPDYGDSEYAPSQIGNLPDDDLPEVPLSPASSVDSLTEHALQASLALGDTPETPASSPSASSSNSSYTRAPIVIRPKWGSSPPYPKPSLQVPRVTRRGKLIPPVPPFYATKASGSPPWAPNQRGLFRPTAKAKKVPGIKRTVAKSPPADLSSISELQEEVRAGWTVGKFKGRSTEVVTDYNCIPSTGRNLQKIRATSICIEHGLLKREHFRYTKQFRNFIFVWDTAPPGEHRRWCTDHTSELDPLPPGWSVNNQEVIVVEEEDSSGAFRERLKYSCIPLEYTEETYGKRTTDWTLAEKDDPGVLGVSPRGGLA